MPNQYLPHFTRKRIGPDVGLRLRSARENRGFCRVQLAKAANVAARTLARIERGSQSPRVETLRNIAEALKIPLDALAVDWSEDEQRRRRHLDHLGPGLRKARQKAGVTLAAAAAAAGVDASTLSRFERMQTDSLRLSRDGVTFCSPALASALGFSSVDALSEVCVDFYGDTS